MARTARKTEDGASYHLLLKGCSESGLFRDSDDYKKMLAIIGDEVAKGRARIFCYCLMEDHAHIVLHPEKGELADLMKLTTGRYASYFNKKYKRSGPVFAGRFKSEPIPNDDYMKRLIRFILQDPVRMKLSVEVTDYPFSSAMQYILPPGSMVDIDTILKLFGDSNSEAKAAYLKYTSNRSAEWFMDENAAPKLKIQHRLDVERRCWKVLAQEYGLTPTELPQQSAELKRSAIESLRREGATIKQIMTMTGSSYYTVQKTCASI